VSVFESHNLNDQAVFMRKRCIITMKTMCRTRGIEKQYVEEIFRTQITLQSTVYLRLTRVLSSKYNILFESAASFMILDPPIFLLSPKRDLERCVTSHAEVHP
jgi:hypothetical protein